MTQQPDSGPRSPPKWVLLAAAVGLALAAWFMLRMYTSDGARECQALYRSARTAIDTARVDTTVTRGSRKQADPPSCGFMRHSNRWQ